MNANGNGGGGGDSSISRAKYFLLYLATAISLEKVIRKKQGHFPEKRGT